MRVDEFLVSTGKVKSRNQAQDLIKRGKVRIGTKIITKPSWKIQGTERVQLLEKERYVSRAGYKLASVAEGLKLDFAGKVVLDVGSSTGGFTDYALRKKAKMVVAVDVGTDQLAPELRLSPRVRLYEKQDIRTFDWPAEVGLPDIIVGDLSFISLTKILPSLEQFCKKGTILAMMAKPQFEARLDKNGIIIDIHKSKRSSEGEDYLPAARNTRKQQRAVIAEKGFKLNGGIVRNNKERREILARLEIWLKDNQWAIIAKRDSDVAGAGGNLERFYLLSPPKK